MKNREVQVVPVKKEQKHLLENLVHLYLHDLSEFTEDLKINQNGQFIYEGFELYFNREDLMPYFITYYDEVIGFIFLNKGRFVPKGIDYSIHELFMLRSFRGKGLAVQAIDTIFSFNKGTYKVEQLSNNPRAIHFWKKLYHIKQIQYEETTELIDNLECFSQIFKID